MAYDSEIIAILSTGISFKRFLFPYMISAAVIALLSFCLSAFIIPNANQTRIEFQKRYINKKFNNKEANIHRQIAPGVFIYMSNYSVASNIGYDFSIETFNNDTLVSKLTSSRITWDKDKEKWVISNWKLRELEGNRDKYTTGREIDTLLGFLPSEFSEDPSKIKEQLTLPELDEYIERMKLRGSSNIIEFQIEKYKIWSNAFATFILTLIGVSISSRKIRGGWACIWGWDCYSVSLTFCLCNFRLFSQQTGI